MALAKFRKIIGGAKNKPTKDLSTAPSQKNEKDKKDQNN